MSSGFRCRGSFTLLVYVESTRLRDLAGSYNPDKVLSVTSSRVDLAHLFSEVSMLHNVRFCGSILVEQCISSFVVSSPFACVTRIIGTLVRAT